MQVVLENLMTPILKMPKLEAWEIKYCIDNDTSRFAWADTKMVKVLFTI